MANTDTSRTVVDAPGGPRDERERFQALFNPATSEWIQFACAPEDGEEDVVRFSWRSMPGGAITEHVHPHQEESFAISAGVAHFTLDGEERVVRAGETIVVPAGVRHSEATVGRSRSKAWSSSVRHCTQGRCTRPSPVWPLREERHPEARRGTRSSSAPPSGAFAARAG